MAIYMTGVTTQTVAGDPLPIAYGGTGQATAAAAINALLPLQTDNTDKVLKTDGVNVSWVTVSSGGGAVTSVAGKTGVVTLVKADVGLGNVDNTSDANKSVSIAQIALNSNNTYALQGRNVSSTYPQTGQVLTWTGSMWEGQTGSSGALGVSQIVAGSGVTISSTGPTPGTGTVTINASGTSGGSFTANTAGVYTVTNPTIGESAKMSWSTGASPNNTVTIPVPKGSGSWWSGTGIQSFPTYRALYSMNLIVYTRASSLSQSNVIVNVIKSGIPSTLSVDSISQLSANNGMYIYDIQFYASKPSLQSVADTDTITLNLGPEVTSGAFVLAVSRVNIDTMDTVLTGETFVGSGFGTQSFPGLYSSYTYAPGYYLNTNQPPITFSAVGSLSGAVYPIGPDPVMQGASAEAKISYQGVYDKGSVLFASSTMSFDSDAWEMRAYEDSSVSYTDPAWYFMSDLFKVFAFNIEAFNYTQTKN